MSHRIWIDQLSFSDGSQFSLGADDIVVFVGPNNSGKSAALRGIRDKVTNPKNPNPVIHSLSVALQGDREDLPTWLLKSSRIIPEPPENPRYAGFGANVHHDHAIGYWTNSKDGLYGLAPFFCRLLNADERLGAANPANNISLTKDSPSHPIHFLQRDDKVELSISKQFRKAFGEDLIVHHNAGSIVPLYMGLRPKPKEGTDRISLEYITKLEELPTLHTQGDGMRSFTGILLYASVGRESILLVDEPEAFLHPPQARLLGRMLVNDKRSDRQLFISTHNGDVLKGILEAGSKKVRVIRLRREGNVNVVRELNNDRIAELWNDPLLRYSDILDGVFHEKVIVTEADGDARFFSAIAERLTDTLEEDVRKPAVKFVHCGGKDRLNVVVRALTAIEVPVIAVADFDVLSGENPLKKIVEAAGGSWSVIQPLWNVVWSAIDEKKPDFKTPEVKAKIEEILAGVTEETFPKKAKSDIKEIFKRSTPWANAKATGKSYVPNGTASEKYAELIAGLRKLGLFVVEVGELENFYKKGSSHGPAWVNQVLEKDLKEDPDLAEARQFVKEMLDWKR